MNQCPTCRIIEIHDELHLQHLWIHRILILVFVSHITGRIDADGMPDQGRCIQNFEIVPPSTHFCSATHVWVHKLPIGCTVPSRCAWWRATRQVFSPKAQFYARGLQFRSCDRISVGLQTQIPKLWNVYVLYNVEEKIISEFNNVIEFEGQRMGRRYKRKAISSHKKEKSSSVDDFRVFCNMKY